MGGLDSTGMSALADELDSKDTKRRLQGLESLAEALRPHGRQQAHPNTNLDLDHNSWQKIVPPLVRTLRDNNFKVCRASLACLESLVESVGVDIVPFLSMITPAAVECLGNSKPTVQDRGVDLLLAVSGTSVNGARETISAVEPHFRHKNWRVRERLIVYLGRAVEVDGAGVLERYHRHQQVQAGARGGSGGLAGLLADALNDSASQVRQEALVAAARLVKLTGEPLLVQLEARGVRSTQLTALRGSSSGGRQTTNKDNDTLSAVAPRGSGELSPSAGTAAPPPFRSTVAAAPRGGNSSSTGGARPSSNSGARRRTTLSRPLTGGGGAGLAGGEGGGHSVLTRAGGGGGGVEGAPTPVGAAARSATGSGGSGVGGGSTVSSPTAIGSPGMSSSAGGGGGEESAFSALEPLVPVKVYTERDVRREVEATKVGLEHGSDWLKWVAAMRRLAGVALGGGAAEFPSLLVGLVRASVQEMVGHKVSENRSAVAREACRCVAVLARCLTDHFGALAELWLPELLRNTTRAVVVAAAGDEAVRAIFGCTTDGFHRLLPCLIETVKNKSAAIRRRCLDYVMLALARWTSDAAFERYLPQIRNMISTGIGDADSSVRVTARRGYWVLWWRFPGFAQSVMDSLSPSMQRHVLREDREFDAEAFVEAVAAAAEDPQPALGEYPPDNQDNSSSSFSNPLPLQSSSTPNVATATVRRTHGGSFSSHQGVTAHTSHTTTMSNGTRPSSSSSSSSSSSPSCQPARSVSANIPASGDVASTAAVARVKIDRGASVGGGGGGTRVARPGGGVPARRMRSRANSQETTTSTPSEGVDSGSIGNSEGGNTTRLAALRVASGNASGGGNSSASDITAMAMAPMANMSGAFRVPIGGGRTAAAAAGVPSGGAHDAAGSVSSSGGISGSVDHFSHHQHRDRAAPTKGAHRVVVRPTTTTTTNAAAVSTESGEALAEWGGGFSGTGLNGGASTKAGRSGTAYRVVGRHRGGGVAASLVSETKESHHHHHHQQQRYVDAVIERGGGPMEAVAEEGIGMLTASVVLDRKEVLRQMDSLADQTNASHWAARVEALERLLELLTVDGSLDGGDQDGGGRGEGGRLLLESRSASRRLEAVIANRLRDAHFRVASAALRLFGGLVEVHPGLMASHASALLPSVFPCLADAKDTVRQAASRALEASRAAYSPHQLCAALCPRVLELAPGRARTGLLEFITVLVPHSASFLGNPNHLQSLTQRVAAALIQSPPPPNWDGRGSSVGGERGDEHAGGTTGAGSAPAAAASIRLIGALYRLDRDAFRVASSSLPHESVAAVRRALFYCCSPDDAAAFLPSSTSSSAVGSRLHHRPATAVERADDRDLVSAGGRIMNNTKGEDHVCSGKNEESSAAAAIETTPAGARSRSGMDEKKYLRKNRGSPISTPFGTARSEAAVLSDVASPSACSAAGSAFPLDEDTGGLRRVTSVGSLSPELAQRQDQLQQQQRQPLAPITPQSINSSGDTLTTSEEETKKSCFSTKQQQPTAMWKTKVSSPSTSTSLTATTVTTRPPSLLRATVVTTTAETEAAEVARRLIAGLTPGARLYKKVKALSSLRSLADGEGVAAGQAEFWPRYFGQVLMLLLEGADSAAGVEGEGESTNQGGKKYSSSSFRRRMLLRAKHVQGVRCLVGRRGALFPDSTEVVVGRLVEIGGKDPSLAVRYEAEACLTDLVAVLDPARYLATLIPLLLLEDHDDDADNHCAGGGWEFRSKETGNADADQPGGQGGGHGQPAAATSTTNWQGQQQHGDGGCSGVLTQQCVVLGALRALTPRLSSPVLLGALGAGPLLAGLEAALGRRDLEARKRAVLALVEMYQVLEEALLPFLSDFPTSRLKLITMYVERRRARDHRAANDSLASSDHGNLIKLGVGVGGGLRGEGHHFAPMR